MVIAVLWFLISAAVGGRVFYSAALVGSVLSLPCPSAFLTPLLCLLPTGSCAAASSNGPVSLGAPAGYHCPSSPQPSAQGGARGQPCSGWGPHRLHTSPSMGGSGRSELGVKEELASLSLPRLMWITMAFPGTLSPGVRSHPAPAGHLLAHPCLSCVLTPGVKGRHVVF